MTAQPHRSPSSPATASARRSSTPRSGSSTPPASPSTGRRPRPAPRSSSAATRPACRRRPAPRSSARASSSRARWRRRSASARRARTSPCASSSRPTPTSAPRASSPACRPVRGRGRRPDHRPRERRGPLRRHRAHADAGRRAVPEAHHPQGQREDRPLRLRVRPPRGRRKVTCATKANIMKLTEGLFKRIFEELAAEYPDIEAEHLIIDNVAHQLAKNPAQFDVIVTTNINGDIISDLTSGLVGGLGFARPGNYGDDVAIFEAVHGSAPKYAGKDVINPTALILSSLMMLRHLGEPAAADRVENAVLVTLEEGKPVTQDLARRPAATSSTPPPPRATRTRSSRTSGRLPTTVPPRAGAERPSGDGAPAAALDVRRRRCPRRSTAQTVGVDLFLETPLTAGERAGRWRRSRATRSLQMVYSRGTMVYPSTGSGPDRRPATRPLRRPRAAAASPTRRSARPPGRHAVQLDPRREAPALRRGAGLHEGAGSVVRGDGPGGGAAAGARSGHATGRGRRRRRPTAASRRDPGRAGRTCRSWRRRGAPRRAGRAREIRVMSAHRTPGPCSDTPTPPGGGCG